MLLALGVVLGAALQTFDNSVLSPYSIFGAIVLTLVSLVSLVLSCPSPGTQW
jgi:hypothetical protein